MAKRKCLLCKNSYDDKKSLNEFCGRECSNFWRKKMEKTNA